MSPQLDLDGPGPYVRLPSGRKQYLLHPTWTVKDAARHLAGTNRYCGAGLSVAQHEIVGAMMAEQFYPDKKLLPARFMIHDLAESTFGDMSSPLKRLCPDYCRLLTDADRSVEEWAGVTFLDDALTKELDTRMWLTERLVVFQEAIDAGIDIDEDTAGVDLEPFPLERHELGLFAPWDRFETEIYWTEEFYRLLPWMKRE